MLEFDNFQGYDKHDFDGWDLFHHVGTIVLIAIVSLAVVAVVGVGIYLYKKERMPFKILEDTVGTFRYDTRTPDAGVPDSPGSDCGGRGATATKVPPDAKDTACLLDTGMSKDLAGRVNKAINDLADSY